jgi:alkylation response protein AidB-like acyl-CoA dehydrogenase
MTTMLATARRIADEVLFPAAADVDHTSVIPLTHWTALADAGLYALAAPPEVGGPALPFPELIEVIEVLASGCMATTFTWIQHHGCVLAYSMTSNQSVRDQFLAAAAAGRLR